MQVSKIKTLIAAPEDGQAGQPAASAVFSPPVLWVNADEDGWSTGDQTFTVTPRVAVNGTLLALEGAPTAWLFPDGIKVRIDLKTHDIEVAVPNHTDYVDYEGEAEFMLTAEYEGVQYNVRGSFSIVAKRKGDQGDDGEKGDKGDDGVTYDIVPSIGMIHADKDGNILTGAITAMAYKSQGEGERALMTLAKIDASGYYHWIQYRIDSGTWSFCSYLGNVATVPANVVGNVKTGLALRLIKGTSANSFTVLKELPALLVVKDGQTGGVGKTGPWWYPAGSWNSNTEYIRNDSVVPVVEHNNYYWYLGKENYASRGEEPTASSKVWNLADNFKVVFCEALFAAFAKLGSAIMNGDWMVSQHGKINGTASTDYTKFKETDPQGKNSGNFCPNFAIDLLAGKAYMNDAVIRGTVHANDGEFNGVVHATGGEFSGVVKTALMYSRNIIVEGTHNIDPVNDPAYMYIVETMNETHTCVLPAAADYDGLELRFYSPKSSTRSGDFFLSVKTKGTDVIVHTKIDESSGHFIQDTVTSCRISNGNVVTLKSMRGQWVIISGENIGITEVVALNGKNLYFDEGILVGYK